MVTAAWGKFHEMAEYYWLVGYEVFFMEHRGHGYRAGRIAENDIVHVNSYNDYTQDMTSVYDRNC